MTVGEAAILDLSDVPENTAITGERIAAAGAHLRRGDIAILKTRWDERADIATPDFWARAPWMTAEAAIWLCEAGIKAVGFDFPQDYCIRFFRRGAPATARACHALPPAAAGRDHVRVSAQHQGLAGATQPRGRPAGQAAGQRRRPCPGHRH
jgi:kynurenine formamidase